MRLNSIEQALLIAVLVALGALGFWAVLEELDLQSPRFKPADVLNKTSQLDTSLGSGPPQRSAATLSAFRPTGSLDTTVTARRTRSIPSNH